jgi:hypothetical protein
MSSENVQSLIIDATTFNPVKQVKYSKMKVNKVGGKSVGIMNSDTGKSLILQTPLILTWGANKFVDEKSGKTTYDMALQFPRDDYQTEENKKFLDAMVAFQNKLKNDAITNSKEWFNKPKMTPEVVDALFHPMLTYAKNKDTGEADMTKSPTLKVKIPYYEDQFNCEVYDTSAKMLFPSETGSTQTPLELITKASNIIAVIQCGGFWFANGKFGVTWKLIQCVVRPKPTLKGRCLISVSSENKTQLEKAAPASASSSVQLGQDEDDEDDASEEVGTGQLKVVEDSDEEGESTASDPQVAVAPVVVEEAVAAPATPATPAVVKKEVKRIVKKKE